MAVPTTNSGKAGKILISTTPITVTRWEVTEEADRADATTAESDGYGVTNPGVLQAKISIEGTFIIGVSKVAPLAPGVRYSVTMTLYTYKISSDASTAYVFTDFTCLSFQLGTPVRDRITFRAELESNNTYTRPVDPA